MRVVRQRLSRQAMAAIGASAIVVGCSGTDTVGTPVYGAPADIGADTAADAVSLDAAYGAPPDTGSFDSGGTTDTASDATPDAPSKDSATDAPAIDGGVKDSGGPTPAYGLPPSDAFQ